MTENREAIIEIGTTRTLHDSGHDLYNAARLAATEGVSTSVTMEGQIVAVVTPVKDDAYWDEVERAVGKGTPSIMLGTSTQSLRKNLDLLRKAASSGEATAWWYNAPLPRRWHRCYVVTSGRIFTGAFYERCACGAARRNGGPWMDRNSRRRTR